MSTGTTPLDAPPPRLTPSRKFAEGDKTEAQEIAGQIAGKLNDFDHSSVLELLNKFQEVRSDGTAPTYLTPPQIMHIFGQIPFLSKIFESIANGTTTVGNMALGSNLFLLMQDISYMNETVKSVTRDVGREEYSTADEIESLLLKGAEVGLFSDNNPLIAPSRVTSRAGGRE
jgi:hypothetical protein